MLVSESHVVGSRQLRVWQAGRFGDDHGIGRMLPVVLNGCTQRIAKDSEGGLVLSAGP